MCLFQKIFLLLTLFVSIIAAKPHHFYNLYQVHPIPFTFEPIQPIALHPIGYVNPELWKIISHHAGYVHVNPEHLPRIDHELEDKENEKPAEKEIPKPPTKYLDPPKEDKKSDKDEEKVEKTTKIELTQKEIHLREPLIPPSKESVWNDDDDHEVAPIKITKVIKKVPIIKNIGHIPLFKSHVIHDFDYTQETPKITITKIHLLDN